MVEVSDVHAFIWNSNSGGKRGSEIDVYIFVRFFRFHLCLVLFLGHLCFYVLDWLCEDLIKEHIVLIEL